MIGNKTKISVIGAGFVGSTTAYAIMLQRLAEEVVIVDINEKKAKSEAMDIAHGTAFVEEIDVKYGDYSDTKDSDIIIITAGPQPKYGETRLDVINKGLAINSQIVPEVVKYSPNAIIIVVANPVDVLTYQTYKLSGFPKERVIGSGTVVDSGRLKYLIGERFGINYRKISTYIFGEHGDSQVATWSATTVSGIKLEDYLNSLGMEINEAIKNDIADKVKKAGFDIVWGKGYTSFGIATAVSRIVKAIVTNEDTVLPISVLYNGEYGIEDVYMAAPCIVGNTGVKKLLEIELSDKELEDLKNSSEVLKEMNKHIG